MLDEEAQIDVRRFLNIRGPDRYTPLMIGVLQDDNPFVVKLLIDANANPAMHDKFQRPVIDSAKANKRTRVVELLQGGSVSATDETWGMFDTPPPKSDVYVASLFGESVCSEVAASLQQPRGGHPGFNVLYNEGDFDATKAWAMNGAHVVVLCLTKAFVRRLAASGLGDPVKREFLHAINRPQGPHMIIPVVCESFMWEAKSEKGSLASRLAMMRVSANGKTFPEDEAAWIGPATFLACTPIRSSLSRRSTTTAAAAHAGGWWARGGRRRWACSPSGSG